MKNILLTAGPTNVPTEVFAALECADHSHRDADTKQLLETIRRSTVGLVGGGDDFTCIPIACSGTGAIEALVRTVAGRLLVLDAGRYSRRIVDIANKCGIEVESLRFDSWTGIDLGRVDALLSQRSDITDVFAVHLETTTGALVPLCDLGALVHQRARRLLVDAVSSAFGHALDVCRDQVTACVIAPNKCLECVPGVAMVVCRIPWLMSLSDRSRSYYFDLYTHYQQLCDEGTPSFTIFPGLLAAVDVAIAEVASNRASTYFGVVGSSSRSLPSASPINRN